MKSLTLAFLLLYVSLTAYANEDLLYEEDVLETEQSRFICGSEDLQGGQFRYCYRDPETANHSDIVYFFHGLGGLQGGRRHIIGQSMGGFNGAELALKKSGMFSRVALLCPAITTVGPYASDQEIDDYIDRTGARRSLVDKMLRISRSVFIDKKDWDNHDPLKLIKNYSSKQKPRFYVSVGTNDGYGFQEGSRLFTQKAGAFSFLFRWVPVPGGHCNFKRIGTAIFIMGD